MQWRLIAHAALWSLLVGGASAQTPVWDVTTIPTDPTFTSVYTTINGTANTSEGPVVDLTMNQLWAAVGQTFPTPRNWSSKNGFSLSVQNMESSGVSLGFLVTPSGGGELKAIFDIPAGETVKIFVDNTGFSVAATGMDRPLPVFGGVYRHYLVFQNQNLSSIAKWSLYYRNENPAHLKISNLVGHSVDMTYANAFDAYGQVSALDWPEKVQNDLDLQTYGVLESAQLAARPGLSEQWGSNSIPKVTATGKWRTIKGRTGKWFIATPQGKLFWALGLTSVSPMNPTVVDDRRGMFQWLPATGTPEAAFYGTVVKGGVPKATYDFNEDNLYRKYGSDWKANWDATAAARLKSWGINTLGSGSDLTLMQNYNIPGTYTISTAGYPTRLATPFAYWGYLPDPYSTALSTWLANKYRADVQHFSIGNRLMGIYVDGENAWQAPGTSIRDHYMIPLAALRAGQTQPSKQVLLAQLRTRYPTIGALNSAWGTTFASWSQMYTTSVELRDDNLTPSAVSDFSKFLSSFAAKYYSSVKDALASMGSTSLFLGSKDSSGWTPVEVHQQAAKYVDAISMTVYGKAGDINWAYLNSLAKPVIIAEFTFASNDRGPSASTNWMGDLQFPAARRAQEAQLYLNQALASPNIIGVNWYSYHDNPVSGRAADTQNYAVGVVDNTDRPYDEMVDLFRDFTAHMYSQRGFW